MIIKELYIKNFGKFSERRFRLDERMQVFYGENEYGKSTIYAFIRAMLFGMERGRGRAAGKDDFSRYEPWENPQYYAGEMRFVCGERNFCLKRQFDRYGRKSVLYCEDDGEELSVEDGDLEMLLGGITADSFENMAAIGQLTARPGQTLAEELKNFAANFYASGSSEIDLNRALEVLKERKKQTERQMRECAARQKLELDKLEVEEHYIESEMEKLREHAARAKERLSKLSDAPDVQEHMWDTMQNDAQDDPAAGQRMAGYMAGTLRKAGIALCVLGILLLAAGGWNIVADVPVSTVLFPMILPLGVFLLIAGLLLTFVKPGVNEAKTAGTEQESTETERTEPDRRGKNAAAGNVAERSALQTDILRAKWELQQMQRQLAEKQIELDNLEERKAERMTPGAKTERLAQTKEALELAMERLTACAADMTEGFGEHLNRKASQILQTITAGKYTRLFVEDKLQLSVFGPAGGSGRRIPVERLSRGTVEQIYFALRMAALDMMYEENIPVIFDDAFGCYDEKRLKSALKWLSKQDRQVIIFSCQKREKEIIELLKKEMSI